MATEETILALWGIAGRLGLHLIIGFSDPGNEIRIFEMTRKGVLM